MDNMTIVKMEVVLKMVRVGRKCGGQEACSD